MKKYAVLSMDVEDWFHLDYFNEDDCDQSQTTLDGLNVYLDILDHYNIKTTFFVVGSLIEKLYPILKVIKEKGHELGLHSFRHKRPLSLSLEEFKEDTLLGIKAFEDYLGFKPEGYRAPCFSMDRERLDFLEELGLSYDSSKIKFDSHSLYGSIDLNDYENVTSDIYKKDSFYEFEASTIEILGKNIPISGGGYLRMFPWGLTRFLLNKYIKKNKNYFFYIHPFEFSKQYDIKVPKNTSFKTKMRFEKGRKSVESKMHKLIKVLNENHYEFVTFKEIVNKNL